jgi:hypothetical protein
LALAPPASAAAKAKPAAGWFTRFLARTAATRDARTQFGQFVKEHPELSAQYIGNKKGAGLSSTIGAVAVVGSPEFVVHGGALSTGTPYDFVPMAGVAASGIFFWQLGNLIRDGARGNTVRFAMANGYRVPAQLVRTMKQAGDRFGGFSDKEIAPFKLKPQSKAAKRPTTAKRRATAKASAKRHAAKSGRRRG